MGFVDLIREDWRSTWRGLRRAPGFSLACVGIVGLGIAAATTVFALVNAVVLRPLPYSDPGALVAIASVPPGAALRGTERVRLTDVESWRRGARTLEDAGGFAHTRLPVRFGVRAAVPVTALVDSQFLPMLGARLTIGGHLGTGAGPAATEALISHQAWVEYFDRDAAALGTAIRVDGGTLTLVGVLAPDFAFPRSDAAPFGADVELVIPASAILSFPASSRSWLAIGRLAPGATPVQAAAELSAVAASPPGPDGDRREVRVTGLQQETYRRSAASLLLALAMAVLLALIAAANVASLVAARLAARSHEQAVKRALGCPERVILRRIVVEIGGLVTVGTLVGLAVTHATSRGVMRMVPMHLPVTGEVGVDGAVAAFGALAAIAMIAMIALVSGLASVMPRGAEEGVLSRGSRAARDPWVTRRHRRICVGQVALAWALLASAAMLTQSLRSLERTDLGFNHDGLAGFSVTFESDRADGDRLRVAEGVVEAVRTLPGVTAAAWITVLPPSDRVATMAPVATPERERPADPATAPVANHLVASADYFAVTGIDLVSGRGFTPGDDLTSAATAVVSELFAALYLRGSAPVGQRIVTAYDDPAVPRTIVGVVRDARVRGALYEPVPTVYVPLRQVVELYGSVLLRTDRPLEAIVPEIREVMAQVDPSVPVADFTTITDRIRTTVDHPRFYGALSSVSAFLAIVLVATGLYGVVAYSVASRTPELAIRLALGATPSGLAGLVLRDALIVLAWGLALGAPMAIASGVVVRSRLYGVDAIEPLALATAAAILSVVTILASAWPAYRASRLPPASVLRG
jgi:putative ABC transport system permease protein